MVRLHVNGTKYQETDENGLAIFRSSDSNFNDEDSGTYDLVDSKNIYQSLTGVAITLSSTTQLQSLDLTLRQYFTLYIQLMDATLPQKTAAGNISVTLTFNSSSLTETSNSTGYVSFRAFEGIDF